MIGPEYTWPNATEAELNTDSATAGLVSDNNTSGVIDDDTSRVWIRNDATEPHNIDDNPWDEDSGPSTMLLPQNSDDRSYETHGNHYDTQSDNHDVQDDPQSSNSSLISGGGMPGSLWSSWFPSGVSREHITNSVRDGVFGNLIAKEENQPNENLHPPQIDDERPTPIDDNDDLTPEGHPPTYEEASADATPSYWESTLLAAGYGDEILVRDMPLGSVIIFILNLLLCVALGYFGFFLGYIFHTTHAGKYGSLTGLGVLIISSALDIKSNEPPKSGPEPEQAAPFDPNSFQDAPALGYVMHPTGRVASETVDSSSEYVSKDYFLLVVGVALILYSIFQYIRAMCEYYRIKRRQAEEDGVTYASPHQSLRQAWDNIFHYARHSTSGNHSHDQSTENANEVSELHTPPRPGSPPPLGQLPREASETV